ncbi:MAG: alpha/beta fold hydrolase [Chloroflexota bacterium]
MNINPWIKQQSPNPNARLRLFCFPYAGGAASIYRTWHQYLPNDIEVCATQLPGRENRIRDLAYTNVSILAESFIPYLLPYLDKPFAFFGHSMGTMIAYELTLQLQARGHSPTHLLMSGRRAPHLPETRSLVHTLADDLDFLQELQRRYSNIPEIIFQEVELRELFIPLLRADLELVETYQPTGETRLSCPIVALGGTTDEHASRADLLAWQTLTTGKFNLHLFPGGHFYLNDQTQPLTQTIKHYLEA